jgi:hypothetical protein
MNYSQILENYKQENVWTELEEYRQMARNLLYLAEALLGLSILCCLLTLRWMQRSGCMNRNKIHQEGEEIKIGWIDGEKGNASISFHDTTLDLDEGNIRSEGNGRLKRSERQWRNMDELKTKLGMACTKK